MSEPIGVVERIRSDFDLSFSRPVDYERKTSEGMLIVRAGRDHLAVRTSEIAGIMRCPPLTTLPSEQPALCGLVGVRGQPLAAYSISGLLGGGSAATGGSWIVLTAADRTVALLFEELDSYVSIGVEAIHSPDAGFERDASREVVSIRGANHGVISVPGLLETIHRSARIRINKE